MTEANPKPPELFPEQPKSLDSACDVRDYSINKIKKYIYGPDWEDTQKYHFRKPSEIFSTGILHPRDIDKTQQAEIRQSGIQTNQQDSEQSNLSKKDLEKNYENEIQDAEISHSNLFPSSAGIFFIVKPDTKINIKYGYSTYVSVKDRIYERNPYTDEDELQNISVDKSNSRDTKLDHIKIKIKVFEKDDKAFVGVYLVNESTKRGLENTVFHVGLKVSILNGQLLPQDSITSESSNEALFENLLVYGVGKGVAVDWNKDNLNGIWTEFVPTYHVPKIESNSQSDANLSIEYLADPKNETPDNEYIENLNLFTESYKNHLEAIKDPSLTEGQQRNIIDAEQFLKRMKRGIEYLDDDHDALAAFKLMNLSILTMFAKKSGYNGGEFFYSNDPQRPPTWKDFQIAFCLAALPGVIDPVVEKKDREIVDLIWFPTGGGKTESYLALLSFTIFLRRLRNPKDIGLTSLMRYTLRLLVQDQFSRLSQLIVVMDYLRKEKFMDYDLGEDQISLGLFVGQATSPNSMQAAIAMIKQTYKNLPKRGKRTQTREIPFILDKCPWCSTDLLTITRHGSEDPLPDPGIDHHGFVTEKLKRNKGKPSCPNTECDYSHSDSPLPILLWEKEVLENPPTVVIGTVDNFAKIAWDKYPTQNFFNYVHNGYKCSPPDLIIQDELHLISGPLGSLVGLYDQLIRRLCSGQNPVKIAVSSATISNASEQVSRLYGNRDLQVIPPPEKEWGESFFMKSNFDEKVSRRYIGVFNSSRSPVVGSIETAAAILQGVTVNREKTIVNEKSEDPYRTLVAYFNSIRELAYSVSSRWVIESRIRFLKGIFDSDFGKFARRFQFPKLLELTSRRSPFEIKKVKEDMDLEYKHEYAEGEKKVIDLLYATNMISVGVDISRLGVMMINGLPKTTAEYIQASSRVGREHPGMVILAYNVNKSRDRSHYENFQSMHEGLYRFVEPTSVTPFSVGARKKGLPGIFFSYLRHFYPEIKAADFEDEQLEAAASWIMEEVDLIFAELDNSGIREELDNIIDKYLRNREIIFEWGNMGGNDHSDHISLIGVFSDSNRKRKHIFDVLPSLRNVDRSVSIGLKGDSIDG